MLAKTVTLICFSLCYVVVFSAREDKNPGAVNRVSVQAFNVISEALLNTAKHAVHLNPYLIPDQHSADANRNYSITDILVRDFTAPRSNFTFQPPNEITWSLRNIGFRLAFNWSYEQRFLFMSLRESGRANLSISGLSVDIGVSPRRNQHDQLMLMLTKCTATVDEVSLVVNRAIDILLKLGLVETSLEWKTTRTVCDIVRMAIKKYNSDPIPSKYPIFSAAGYGRTDLIFDYGLMRDPIVTETHVQMNHWGRFIYMLDSDWENVLLPAPKMTIPTSRYMFTSAVTNYPFNTLFDAIMRSKHTSLYLTRLHFWTGSGSLLDTTCGSEPICFGKIFPEIAKRYPNESVTMLVNLTTRPDLTIKKDSFTITGGYHIDFNITERSGKQTPMLSLQLSMSVTATAYIANSTLFGKLKSAKLVFSSASSPFIKNTAEFLKRLNKRTEDDMDKYIQRINKAVARGLPFLSKYPYIYLQAVNPQLLFIPGNIIFNVDFSLYSPLN